MEQTSKELLLEDLCSRLPYGLYIQDEYGDIVYISYNDVHFANYFDSILNGIIKPYLFPLSSMTEEQKREYNMLQDDVTTYHYEYGDVVEDVELCDNWVSIDYLNANHFDYRGLIEKGLAIDATGKCIY